MAPPPSHFGADSEELEKVDVYIVTNEVGHRAFDRWYKLLMEHAERLAARGREEKSDLVREAAEHVRIRDRTWRKDAEEPILIEGPLLSQEERDEAEAWSHWAEIDG